MKLGIVPKPIEPVLKRGQPQGNASTEKGSSLWYGSCAWEGEAVRHAQLGSFSDHS